MVSINKNVLHKVLTLHEFAYAGARQDSLIPYSE